MQLYAEYRNQNAHRKYPFADDASLVSKGGTAMPVDYLVDAFLTPVSAGGPIYLSSLDTALRHMEFTDAQNGQVCAVADWDDGDATAEVWSYGQNNAGWEITGQIGLVVFGNTAGLLGESPMLFTVTTAPLLASCVVPLLQAGVRSFITQPDGLHITGDVILEGRNGVVVTTDAYNVVRVDAYGAIPPASEDCDGRPPIKTVKLVTEPCSRMIASAGTEVEGTAAIIYLLGQNGFVLSDTCKKPQIPDADGVLPSQKDACNPGPAPTPWTCDEEGSDVEYSVPITTGFLTISAPAAFALENPFTVRVTEAYGESIDSSLPDGATSPEALNRRIKQLMDTGVRPTGRITIAMRGSIR